jgi:hypothetical protein
LLAMRRFNADALLTLFVVTRCDPAMTVMAVSITVVTIALDTNPQAIAEVDSKSEAGLIAVLLVVRPGGCVDRAKAEDGGQEGDIPIASGESHSDALSS